MEASQSENGRSVSRRSKNGPGRKGGDDASVLEVRKLIETLKESKVQEFKSDKFEIKFSPFAFLPEQEKSPNSKIEEDMDELLLYSAPSRS